MNRAFVFIGEPFDLVNQLNLGADFIMRRATMREQLVIKKIISPYVDLFDNSGYSANLQSRYENKMQKSYKYFNKHDFTYTITLEPLKHEDYRYCVVTKVNHEELFDHKAITLALQLTDKVITPLFWVNYEDSFINEGSVTIPMKYILHKEIAIRYYSETEIEEWNFDSPVNEEVQQIGDYVHLIDVAFGNFNKNKNLNVYQKTKDFEGLVKINSAFELALEDFQYLQKVLTYEPLRFVGTFAILENLVVRNNKFISAQLKKNVAQIVLRSKRPLIVKKGSKKNLSLDFLEQLVGELYRYRSSIAHGNKLDHGVKLQVLRNLSYIEMFNILNLLLKRAIIQYLINPGFVEKLKDETYDILMNSKRKGFWEKVLLILRLH